MDAKERAKKLMAKFFLEGDLPEEEAEELNHLTMGFTSEVIKEEMREDPKYKTLMTEWDFYAGILSDKFRGRRNN